MLPRFKSLTAAALIAFVAPAYAAATTPLEFTKEFIRQLGELESYRDAAAKSLRGVSRNETFSEAIHWSTRTQLALQTHISVLKSMVLSKSLAETRDQIVEIDQMKIGFHQRLIDSSEVMLKGPQHGVDYGSLAVEIPKVRAQLEELDSMFVTISPLIFVSLIAEKPDSQGHMSRLSITRAERGELRQLLKIEFGKKLDLKNQDDLVNAAWVIRGYLSDAKGYRCSDEPAT